MEIGGSALKRLFFISITLLLTACGTTQQMKLVYKEGSVKAERMRALDECEFEAVKEIPRAMAVEMQGGYSSPGTVQCSTLGGITSCQQIGAINIPASAQSYDANTSTRLRYVNRCLERKGYSVLDRPVCKSDEDKAAGLAADAKQPHASQIPCGIPSRFLN